MKDKITIDVPTQWSDVSVHKFHEYTGLVREDYKSDIHYTAKVASVLCGIDVTNIPQDVFVTVANELSFLSTPISTEKVEEIEIDGDIYRWKGNLNQITVGEMISIEQIIDLEKLFYNETYDVIAAVLLRKVNKDGTLEQFDSGKFSKYRDMFMELPITDLYGTVNFFIAGGKICTGHSVNYLVRIMSTPMSTQKKSWLSRKLSEVKGIITQHSNG